MSDELFFPTGAYALWCAQGEPVVDLVAGRQIFAVNFFLAWDRPSVDETGRTAWEFDKELRFSLVDDEVHITGLGELPRWVVAGFSVWTEDWRETGDTGEEELPHSEVPRVLELVWPLLYDGFDVSPLGRPQWPHLDGYTSIASRFGDGLIFDSVAVLSVAEAQTREWGYDDGLGS